MNKSVKIFVDMDDTICDFMTPWIKDTSKQINILKKKIDLGNKIFENEEIYDKYLQNGLYLDNLLVTRRTFIGLKYEEQKNNFNLYKPVIESLIQKIELFISDRVRMHLTKEEKHFFRYPQSRPNFLLNLKPIPGALETIKMLQQYFHVMILTKPSYMNAHCYTEKRLWVEANMGLDMCEELYFAPDKSHVHGDYLIDDNIWKFSGEHIHFGQPGFETWQQVFNYIMEKEYGKSC